MGSSAQQFTNIMAVVERIEQGIRTSRIYVPIKRRGFEGKRKEVDHVEGGYKGKKNSFQKYHTPSQIANINLRKSWASNQTPKSPGTVTPITAAFK
jgi:hypothetical protein